MPGPFPGMDPWLESPTEWPGFHDMLVVFTVQVLQPQLRARGYYAKPGERVWLTQPRRPIYPDVATFKSQQPPAAPASVAILEPDEPVRVQQAEVEIHEGFVEVYNATGNELVTAIEYLSPTNKSDTLGRELYRQKQLELQQTDVHLVEVDFIRRGPHVLDVPPEIVEQLRPWNYLVNLVRRGSDCYEVYPIPLRDHLPRIRIPLKGDDEDAVLDLQEVFDRSYDSGPYPESLDYAAAPDPPLSEDDVKWADELLKHGRDRSE